MQRSVAALHCRPARTTARTTTTADISVAHAIKSGYRHIDGALCYGNEDEVGAGIRKSGVPREELFITSKL